MHSPVRTDVYTRCPGLVCCTYDIWLEYGTLCIISDTEEFLTEALNHYKAAHSSPDHRTTTGTWLQSGVNASKGTVHP